MLALNAKTSCFLTPHSAHPYDRSLTTSRPSAIHLSKGMFFLNNKGISPSFSKEITFPQAASSPVKLCNAFRRLITLYLFFPAIQI